MFGPNLQKRFKTHKVTGFNISNPLKLLKRRYICKGLRSWTSFTSASIGPVSDYWTKWTSVKVLNFVKKMSEMLKSKT